MMPIILIKKPTLTISIIRILPLPNIIAFGGVATGIMNAHDAESVAGIINNSGFVFMTTATDERIGRIISVVAVLEVSSVKKVIAVQVRVTIMKGGVPARSSNFAPIIPDRPVT